MQSSHSTIVTFAPRWNPNSSGVKTYLYSLLPLTHSRFVVHNLLNGPCERVAIGQVRLAQNHARSDALDRLNVIIYLTIPVAKDRTNNWYLDTIADENIRMISCWLKAKHLWFFSLWRLRNGYQQRICCHPIECRHR